MRSGLLVRLWGAAAITVAAAACSEGSPVGPPDDAAETLMVDASTDWAFVQLGSPAAQVSVAGRGSAGWDMAFFSTTVMLNGGAAGPGSVEGYCVCQNNGATDVQLLAMTPASELADFEAVTVASIPATAAEWTTDVLAPAINGWYAYDPVSHQVSADAGRSWKIRLAEATDPGYAKLHVIGLEGATQSAAGRVTIEYAVQSGLGAPLGETKTAVLDASEGTVHFDFASGAVSDETDWDIALEGYTIRMNGGVSGAGNAGAVLASESFAAITDASDAPAQVYRADAFGGVFDANRWYRYNLTGSHDITPTYDVYLIRRGTEVYKVQVTGYYNETGESRHVTFRYEQIAG